ncbi:DUF983 domain-containing protein [Mucilaginibacter rubeus]|uniref:DUF983 domain-containing protein n=3 Tax=Sphingobacteriaceae TaxID=84566 RepID=A0AAE6MHL9_9SPHI|nr:DUF983 domain-containing protein [Mucilaginibacter rubeus]QEM16366.1 DUF983 domain-containing protein [Mucilaginibacter gossypii]QEM03755.1 DUF983 domain-containing protein [Mucilaginibacter rubeus]QTE40866.1 DUF983 domain-containing protein [Mucilaginibacter rubeus]QTE47469.1 DUF983 domain-containing protein [Mucilaginibacter rubeus]QTE58862.1 DUF983 domain-containing protein [Mucilaginibacter rubeus]
MNNANKWPLWPAVIHAKCPRCRRGKMFANAMYGFHGQQMLKQCDHCKLTYEIEPGYFYVAMFVSYGMNVAVLITLSVALSVLTGSTNPWLYVIVLLTASLILSPFNFRYSRVILLYWLTPGLSYQPEYSADKPESVLPASDPGDSIAPLNLN